MAITRWPAITRHPESKKLYQGESITFSADVKGAGPFSYQWLKGGSPVSGATQKSLTLNDIQFADAGNYTLVASNAYGATESLAGQLSLFAEPQITLQPVSQMVFTGAKVVFSSSAIGAPPLYYQWYHGSVRIPGATSNNLVLARTAVSDAGTYSVLISNSINEVRSDTVTLTLTLTHTWPANVPGTVVGLRGPAVPPNLTNVIAVAAGDTHALAVRADGTLAAWGCARSQPLFPCNEAVAPSSLSNVVAVNVIDSTFSIGYDLALRADGTAARWVNGGTPGDVAFGILGIEGGLLLRSDRSINGISNVVSMDAALYGSATFVRDDGSVVISGSGWPGGVSISNMTAASMGTGPFGYTMLLRADGRVIAGTLPGLASLFYSGDPTVPGLSNVVAIAAGNNFGLALKDDGTVAGIGIDVPADLNGVTTIAAGGFGLAITTNPPQPRLAMTLTSSGEPGVLSRVSVPNYILESADHFGGAFTEVPGYTNAFYATNSESFEFKVVPQGNVRIFRLRKQ